MTWRTSEGDRVLEEGEQYVFVVTLENILNDIARGDSTFHCGLLKNKSFNRISSKKKAALFWKVAHYLLEDTGADIPEPTSFDECAIFYVYKYFNVCELEGRLMMCEDMGYDDILSILLMYCDEEEPELPSGFEDFNHRHWEESVMLLADRILWDRDFEDFIDSKEAYCEDPRFPATVAIERCLEYLQKKRCKLHAKLFEDEAEAEVVAIPAVKQDEKKKKKTGKKQSAESAAAAAAAAAPVSTSAASASGVAAVKKRRTSGKKLAENPSVVSEELQPKKKARGGNNNKKK